MIIKEVIGSLEVDSERGNIWLNSIYGNCILRINGLNFKNKLQNSSMIDINKNTAYMHRYIENENDENITEFIKEIINVICSKIMEGKFDEKKDYKKVVDNINKLFE